MVTKERRRTPSNTELIQFRVTKLQKEALEKGAHDAGVTVAELVRQQVRPLIARIVAGGGQDAAA